MIKTTMLVFTILFLASVALAEEWTVLNNAAEPFTVTVQETSGDRTVLRYSVNKYATEQVAIDGQPYTLLQKLRKESMIEEQGYPRLPRINRSLLIPGDGTMSYKILSSKYVEVSGVNVAPSKGNILRTTDPNTVPYTFSDIYQQNAFYPAELVHLRDPYILRDFRGVVVELNAFLYNPVTRTLRVYTDVTLEVKKISSGGENVLQRPSPPVKVDPQFDKFYRRHFLNYSALDYVPVLESGGLLVICYDSFMPDLEPFVEWKNQKGLPTTIVPVSQVGTTTDQIKSYIRDVYITSDLCYVLLVGDNPQIPTYSSGSDPVYSQLSGGDDYPEIFIGRFSAENREQVQTQVERTITYEKYPDPAGTWYSKGLGDADESGPCNPEAYDFQHITNLAYDLLRWNYTQMDSVYTTFGGTSQMISNYLNDGRSIFNYAGHGWTQGVGPVNFTNSDIDNLVNDNMLPHFVAIACLSGNFVNGTCMGEAWLRATNELTGEPTGAIAVYLSKVSQSWFPPYDMQDEGVDLLCADSMLTFGGMCFNGSGLMIDLWPLGGYEFENWTIFGDPSVYLRSMTPYPLTVSHNPTIPVGTSTFNVTVAAPGGPLAGALVCGMNEEIYATGVTNASGQVLLTFDPPPVIPGTFTLTVTTANAIPYIEEVDVITPNGPYVIHNDHEVQDDLTGNNNGQLDYAETVQLSMSVENVGVQIANNVTGVLSTDDSLVTIIQNQANFGNIPVADTVTVDRAYEFQITPTVSDGHPVLFLLTTSDGVNVWESNFSVIAHAPEVEFEQLIIHDETGNNNGNLDPGEAADLEVVLQNNGSSGVNNVGFTASCTDPFVTITNATANIGALNPGASASGTISVVIASTCPQEHSVTFSMVISGSSGYAASGQFTTVVGDLLFAPTGPDNYGYLAYDPFDAPETPDYNWVEISADSAGPGTLVNFTSDEQVFQFDLPFSFQYYGQDFTRYTIAANGWIAMGDVLEDDYSNSAIPNSDGPANMIAAYWEDLSPQRTNSGKVWRWFDATNHRLVVEYNHIEQFAPANNFETFQVILFDPAYYPTASGDGKILVQYKDMSTASQTEGTIGIENGAENDGLQYCLDGVWDEAAHPVTDGFALLYTTIASAPQVDITLTPLSPPIQIPANGGSFQYNVSVANSETTPSTFDAWIMVQLPALTWYGPVLGPFNLTLPAGAGLTRMRTQNVPASAPAGLYTYRGYVGTYSSVKWDSSSFTFTKLGSGSWGLGAGDWENTGESFEAWLTQVQNVLPAAFSLEQNYPNPFNPVTAISYQLAANSFVKLSVYDLAGRLVETLVNGFREAGVYQVTFDASKLASGIYLCRIEAGDFTATRKMVLLK